MTADTSLGIVFLSEAAGTAMLTLLGCGVVANVLFARGTGASSQLMIAWGWGLAVFSGVYVAAKSGAHLNPAITLGQLARGVDKYAPGVAVSAASTVTYLAAQFLGAFLGAVFCWLAFKRQFDSDLAPAEKLAIFSTAPETRSHGWNTVTEMIATFVLVYVVLNFGGTPSGLGPLAVALVVVGIGLSLGGPTGYAINPARDLGPRLAHRLLPIAGKGDSDWGYAWVPIVGPVIGGVVAGLAARWLPIVVG